MPTGTRRVFDDVNHEPTAPPLRHRRTLTARFAVSGAIIGLLIGVYESTLLATTPHVKALLQPDVCYVVWFLAPLLDMIFFGLLGTILGAIATRGHRTDPLNRALLAAFGLGLASAFAFLNFHLFHVRARDFGTETHLIYAIVSFFVAFVLSMGFLFLAWEQIGGFFDDQTEIHLKPAVRPLAIAGAISVAGMAFFLVTRYRIETKAQANTTSASRPNIVFITLDTVRADHLFAYGYPHRTTPNLDRFAKQGVLFENAIAPASWTLPSHATIFTGLLPHQHGADWAVAMNSGPWTLAEVLKSHGYETAGFNANLFYGERGWGIAQGFEVYGDDGRSLRHNLQATMASRALWEPFYQNLVHYDLVDRRDAHQLNDDVFRWYRQRSSRPFFLFINYFDAHLPYQARPPFDRRVGKAKDRLLRKMDYLIGHAREPQKLPHHEQAALESAYDDCLEYLDEQVGALVRELARSPGTSNTIFIITSDHGEAFGEHGRYSHGWDLYREETHVPLIIFGAGVPNNLRVGHIARLRDLFSTVLDFALPKSALFSARSLRRFWMPEYTPVPFDESVISELIPVGSTSPHSAAISLMTDEWQFIHHANGKEELYRWKSDPGEHFDRSGIPEDRPILDSLRTTLQNLTRHSLEPWLAPGYLLALDQPEISFLSQCKLADRIRTNPSGPPHRVGTAQAHFALDSSAAPRPAPTDEELLKSLPYQ